ncbi:helix-turn-helix domain-containing protein [Actinophytocola glycyrrhizae]|uniref:Helix-turn-helix domain-containing protein n=1 Tax=Actinophytocola glycyrrhizae TaxID=2044873 RepID=A0ABV9RYC5_9PSEU
MSELAELQAESLRTAVGRAVGAELRSVREARGVSRVAFVQQLPSGVGARTLLAYEHGVRQLTLSRLVELAEALDIDPGVLVTRGLQRARLYLERVTLHVDLYAVLHHPTVGKGRFRAMLRWAGNALNENPHGIAEVDVKVVRNLALLTGCSHRDLAGFLAQFTPSPGTTDDEEEKGD